MLIFIWRRGKTVVLNKESKAFQELIENFKHETESGHLVLDVENWIFLVVC